MIKPLKLLRAIIAVVILGSIAVVLSFAYFIIHAIHRRIKAAYVWFFGGVIERMLDIVKNDKQKQDIERLQECFKNHLN